MPPPMRCATGLMPINRRYPLKELLAACKRFPLPARRMITFEYVLIRGVNDSLDDAKRLVKLIQRHPVARSI